jgi:Flp pilus assembly protein TadG
MHEMRARHRSDFASAEGGNIAILFAVVGALLIGAAGIGFDFMRWGAQRAALQEAADAGAIAGAVELGLGGHNVVNRAKTRAEKLSLSNQFGALAGVAPAVAVDKNAQTVTVSLSAPAVRGLSKLVIKEESTLDATATAKVAGKTVACIYALNPTAPQALRGNGSAVVQGTNCAIYVNSSAADALTNSGTISADLICVVGGYSGGGYSPAPTTGCPPVADPFAALVIPAAGGCTATDAQYTSDAALNPGVFCGGLKATGNATLTLAPGAYHIVDGALKIASGASVVGDGVVFILSGTATLDISGSGAALTTPPTTGALAGYSIVQDRAAPLGTVSKVTGEGRFEFPGIVYLPRTDLDIAGRAAGNINTPTYAAIVADTITVSGQGELLATADTALFDKDAAQQITVVNARLIE